ncbi:MAG TPA: glycoside hydrolase family 28 protein [Chitinophagaceae bacterium]|jgi:DNA sulfur modification protein DndE
MKAWIATAVITVLFFGPGNESLKAQASADPHDLAYYLSRTPFKMQEPTLPQPGDKSFKLSDYGGIADGKTLNTDAFEKAISACAAAGGGKVLVSPGTWLTGPIRLQSNVNLHLEKGALVQLTKDHTQYPMITAGNKSTSIVPASPVYGYGLKNIAITGEGIIDGAGDSWRPVKKSKTTGGQWGMLLASGGVVSQKGDIWWPSRDAMNGEDYLKSLKEKKDATPNDYLPARDYLRPYMLYLVNCENILLEGITLRNSPKFVFYPNNCTNLTMRAVNVYNDWWAQNGDGIDISACKNVVIFNCTVSAGDDGICMKSSGGKKDNPDAANLENILIAGCTVLRAHGGFVIGSNTDGGMRNIFVSDCHFIGTDVGIRVKSNAGRGGLVKDIFVEHISMRNIVHEAISFDTYYEDAPAGTSSLPQHGSDKIPEFTGFHISNIECLGAKNAISIRGLPQMPVHDIYFDNVSITAEEGVTAIDAGALHFNKTKIMTANSPVFLFNNTAGASINEGFLPDGARVFVRAEGKTSDIKVTATSISKPSAAFSIGGGAAKNAISME